MKTEKTFYTYFHTRNDTNAVFYVGKGYGKRAHDLGRNPHWKNIVAKHGHTVHIAAEWSTEQEAFEHEKFLILCFKDLGLKLANMTNGGEGISGLVHTQEAKAKISAASKKQMESAEKREHLRACSTGRTLSLEARAKISARFAGKKKAPLAPETKAKLSAINTGKKLTEEHKAKIGRAHAGKEVPFEMRERISNSLKGRPLAAEHKANVVAALVGRVPSDTTKEKLRLAARAQWKRYRGE